MEDVGVQTDSEILEQKPQEAPTWSHCYCAFLHHLDNLSPRCGLQTCNYCSSVARLDEEISEIHNKLHELLKKRLFLQTQMNIHLKPAIDRLPFELISRIFVLYNTPEGKSPFYTPWSLRNPLHLGRVCRKWRDITIRTPRLWTTVRFTARYSHALHDLHVAKAWLSRSGSLPLAIMIRLSGRPINCNSVRVSSSKKAFNEMIDLIRAHSNRWSHVNIWSNHAPHIHKLLDRLPCIPHNLEYLSLGTCSKDGLPKFKPQRDVLFPKAISQSMSYVGGVGPWNLPCGFNRLTSIETSHSPIDEALYLIQNAPNLEKCIISSIHDKQNKLFPLPTSPIIAPKVTFLEIVESQEILRYLTLPSLQFLNTSVFLSLDDNNCIFILETFLARSSPPLQQCTWSIGVGYSEVITWYERFPAITSLKIEIDRGIIAKYGYKVMRRITEHFLTALTRTGPDMVLPNLESLTIYTYGLSETSWSLLCQIFGEFPDQIHVNEGVQTSVGQQTRLDRLKKVKINLSDINATRHQSLEQRVFDRFKALKDSGVDLTVVTPTGGPKFGRSN